MMNQLAPGSPFFLPHGTRMLNKLQSFLRNEYHKRGYQEVVTPLIFSRKLWEISGHYENYREDMFQVSGASHRETFANEEDKHNHEFMLKPMNCPGNLHS
jgi:threonyl-tRNA synthetase